MDNGQRDYNLIFVPGLMGSTLVYKGPGPFGQPMHVEIWSENGKTTISSLAKTPHYLTSNHVQPRAILREVRFLKKRIVYGKLLDFIESRSELDFSRGTDFFPFPYDWRLDVQDTAQRLGKFMRNVDSNPLKRFRIVAHSMGGVITRLMLQDFPDIADRVDRFIQIASPIKGSTLAFYTLDREPSFDGILHLIRKWYRMLNFFGYQNLINSIRNIQSIHQLLPPASEKILQDVNGRQYSAMDEKVWNQHNWKFRQSVLDVQKNLALPLKSSIHCVYSNCRKTDFYYLVNAAYNFKALQSVAKGDGTVTCHSAIAETDLAARTLIRNTNADHVGLCSDSDLFNILRNELP